MTEKRFNLDDAARLASAVDNLAEKFGAVCLADESMTCRWKGGDDFETLGVDAKRAHKAIAQLAAAIVEAQQSLSLVLCDVARGAD